MNFRLNINFFRKSDQLAELEARLISVQNRLKTSINANDLLTNRNATLRHRLIDLQTSDVQKTSRILQLESMNEILGAKLNKMAERALAFEADRPTLPTLAGAPDHMTTAEYQRTGKVFGCPVHESIPYHKLRVAVAKEAKKRGVVPKQVKNDQRKTTSAWPISLLRSVAEGIIWSIAK